MLAEVLTHLSESQALSLGCWRADGKFTSANNAFLSLIGCTQEEVAAGKVNWPDLTPPEYAPLDKLALQEIATRGICAPFEKEYMCKDGKRVPVLIVAMAYGKGTMDAGAFYVVDLSQRKKYGSDAQAHAAEEIRELTDRQRLVCFLLSLGESEKRIASTLNVSLRTVQHERYQVANRLTIPTAHVLIWAVENRRALFLAIQNKSAIPNRYAECSVGQLLL